MGLRRGALLAFAAIACAASLCAAQGYDAAPPDAVLAALAPPAVTSWDQVAIVSSTGPASASSPRPGASPPSPAAGAPADNSTAYGVRGNATGPMPAKAAAAAADPVVTTGGPANCEECVKDFTRVCTRCAPGQLLVGGACVPLAPAFVYLGCYGDAADRALPNEASEGSAMTLEVCRQWAARRGYSLFGTLYSAGCYGGNDYARATKYGKVVPDPRDKGTNAACPGKLNGVPLDAGGKPTTYPTLKDYLGGATYRVDARVDVSGRSKLVRCGSAKLGPAARILEMGFRLEPSTPYGGAGGGPGGSPTEIFVKKLDIGMTKDWHFPALDSPLGGTRFQHTFGAVGESELEDARANSTSAKKAASVHSAFAAAAAAAESPAIAAIKRAAAARKAPALRPDAQY